MKVKTECPKHGWDDKEADTIISIRHEDPIGMDGAGSREVDFVLFVRHKDHFDVFSEGPKGHTRIVGDVTAYLRRRQLRGHNGHERHGSILSD